MAASIDKWTADIQPLLAILYKMLVNQLIVFSYLSQSQLTTYQSLATTINRITNTLNQYVVSTFDLWDLSSGLPPVRLLADSECFGRRRISHLRFPLDVQHPVPICPERCECTVHRCNQLACIVQHCGKPPQHPRFIYHPPVLERLYRDLRESCIPADLCQDIHHHPLRNCSFVRELTSYGPCRRRVSERSAQDSHGGYRGTVSFSSGYDWESRRLRFCSGQREVHLTRGQTSTCFMCLFDKSIQADSYKRCRPIKLYLSPFHLSHDKPHPTPAIRQF